MHKSKTVLIFILLISLIVFVSLTNPNDVSLLVILVPFALLGLIIYNVLTLVIGRLYTPTKVKNNYKVKLFSFLGAVIVINFALLSSIGQLTVQDGAIAFLITIIGGFYLYRFQIK